MSKSNLLRILVPNGSLDATVRDYVHNLIINTELGRLSPSALRQLQRIDAYWGSLNYDNVFEIDASEREENREKQQLAVMLTAYLHKEGNTARTPAPPDAPLDTNIKTLVDLLGLSPLDGSILLFLTVVQLDGRLTNLVDSFKAVSVPFAASIICAALNVPFAAVQASISPESILMQSGAIVLERRELSFSNKIYLRWGLLDLMVTPSLTCNQLLTRFLPLARAPLLEIRDFNHLDEEVTLAMDL